MAKLVARQYAKILYHTTKNLSGKHLEYAVLEFLKFLAREQNLKKIDKILPEFEAYTKEKEGVDAITITSAQSLSKNILNELAGKFSSNFEIEHLVDGSLIGGVKIQKQNMIFDASVKTQLTQLKQSLSH